MKQNYQQMLYFLGKMDSSIVVHDVIYRCKFILKWPGIAFGASL